MGAGASLGTDQLLNDESDGDQTAQRYFCHECNQITRSSREVQQCGACNSSFIEAIEGSSAESAMSMIGGGSSTFGGRDRGGGGSESRRDMNLSQDQSRRLANAAIMLRLLERQLQGELESIQAQYRQSQAEQEAAQCMSPVMKRKLRRPKADIDMIVAQPSCPICSEDFEVGCEVMSLPCSHIYCESCVVPWLDMKKTCPICRFELNNDLPSVIDLEKHTRQELANMLEEEKKEYAEEERARKVKEASDDMAGGGIASKEEDNDDDLSSPSDGKEIINKTKIAKEIIEVMQQRRSAVEKEKGLVENDRLRELRERQNHPRAGGFRTAEERAANPSPSNRTLREVIEEGERENSRQNAERRERMRALGILPAATGVGGSAEEGTSGTLPSTRTPTAVGANPAGRDDFSRVLAAILQTTNMGLSGNEDSESDEDDNPFLTRRIAGSSIGNPSVDVDVAQARTNLQNARSSLASAREENERLEGMRVIPIGGSVRSTNAPTTFVIRSNGDSDSMQIERRQALREAIDNID